MGFMVWEQHSLIGTLQEIPYKIPWEESLPQALGADSLPAAYHPDS